MNMATDIPKEVVESAVELARNEGEMLVGFKPITETDPMDSGRWIAKLWMVITNKGYYEFTPDGICVRGAVLHPIHDNSHVYVVDTAHWPPSHTKSYERVMEIAVDLILHSGLGPEDKDDTGTIASDMLQSQLQDVMFRNQHLTEMLELLVKIQSFSIMNYHEMKQRENDMDAEEEEPYTGPKMRFFMGYSLAQQDSGQWSVLRGGLLKMNLSNLQQAEAWAVAHSEGRVQADV